MSNLVGAAALVALLISGAAAGGQTGEVAAVPELDLAEYAGLWYEIARFPNRFQNDCAGEVTAEYALRADGRIDVRNACNRANGERQTAAGIARRAAEDRPPSQLKVRFAPGFLTWLPFVWADYWVLAIDPQYSLAAVGTPDRDYLWILSREPALADDRYADVVTELAAMGFPVDRLEPTRQSW